MKKNRVCLALLCSVSIYLAPANAADGGDIEKQVPTAKLETSTNNQGKFVFGSVVSTSHTGASISWRDLSIGTNVKGDEASWIGYCDDGNVRDCVSIGTRDNTFTFTISSQSKHTLFGFGIGSKFTLGGGASETTNSNIITYTTTASSTFGIHTYYDLARLFDAPAGLSIPTQIGLTRSATATVHTYAYVDGGSLGSNEEPQTVLGESISWAVSLDYRF